MQTKSEGPWLFAALCIFWGGNWLATKGLVMNAPPFASAAARALLCGAVMLALAGRTEVRTLFAHAPLRIVAIGLLTSTICNGAIYWGVARLSTGLAAIVNNALTPIGLLLFGYLLGEETLSRRRLAGIALGVVGWRCCSPAARKAPSTPRRSRGSRPWPSARCRTASARCGAGLCCGIRVRWRSAECRC